jgi:hypothetical protein
MTNEQRDYMLALETVAVRAEILLLAPTDHAQLVARGKLRDALGIALKLGDAIKKSAEDSSDSSKG